MAAPAGAVPEPTPGLHLPPTLTLAPGAFGVHGQAALEDGRYPVFDLGFAQGMGGSFEFQGRGVFRHARFASFGEVHRVDADELEVALTWCLVSGARGGGLAARGGWARFRERIEEGPASASSDRRTFRWGEGIAALGGPAGSRFTAGFRGLHERESAAWVTAAVAGVELPRMGKLTPLADAARLLRTPSGRTPPWPARMPWGAGARIALDGGDFLLYWSNTRGTTVSESLAGGDALFLNLRLTFRA